MTKEVYLIAEAGSNHNGNFRTAKRLIIAAAEAGADAVKFQLFSLATLIATESFERALRIPDASWRTGFRKLEFPLPWLPKLLRVAERVGIDLLCTPFDLERMAYYLGFDPPAVKIASGDITFHALLAAAGRSGKPVLLSAGAATQEEIKAALALTGKKKTVVLDCVMSYPADAAAYGLDRFEEIQAGFSVPVGLSDHTLSAALAAIQVQKGVCVVEKHFTLDRRQRGADHNMSTEPEAFRLLALALRDALALRGKTKGGRGDAAERKYARRAVYARTDIAKGELFTEKNTIPLRPATGGVTGWDWSTVLGEAAFRGFVAGEAVKSNNKRKKH